jgi:2-oxoglutarate ferredoxin oxidoreductase subunit alpha
MSSAPVSLQGNRACAFAAIAAGCRFFAGYPITPSSEIAETMSRELPRIGGVFIQMEDEIGSLAAVIGASFGGVKAMTATSGPGFSLMQEHLGYAAMTEVPCVIVDVMRGGPSTGMPTRPSQGDLMQARWGTHGDHPIIALAPASVKEIYSETIRAFDLAERLRTPVVVLFDEVVAHLIESVTLPPPGSIVIAERKCAKGDENDFHPFAETDDLVPPMARPGDGLRVHTTGLTHTADGFPTQQPALAARAVQRLIDKIERHRDEVVRFETVQTEDAEFVVVAVGIVARAARRAVADLRAEGLKVGLFRPITLWPFPERAARETAGRARRVLVAEMNAGQLALEIERLAGAPDKVARLNRIDGEPIAPAEIAAKIRELAANG